MQLRRLNGCFGSVVAAWNLVLRVIFPKGDAESSAPGFRERPVSDAQAYNDIIRSVQLFILLVSSIKHIFYSCNIQ
jgi:hypothetical protein